MEQYASTLRRMEIPETEVDTFALSAVLHEAKRRGIISYHAFAFINQEFNAVSSALLDKKKVLTRDNHERYMLVNVINKNKKETR